VSHFPASSLPSFLLSDLAIRTSSFPSDGVGVSDVRRLAPASESRLLVELDSSISAMEPSVPAWSILSAFISTSTLSRAVSRWSDVEAEAVGEIGEAERLRGKRRGLGVSANGERRGNVLDVLDCIDGEEEGGREREVRAVVGIVIRGADVERKGKVKVKGKVKKVVSE